MRNDEEFTGNVRDTGGFSGVDGLSRKDKKIKNLNF